jgi:hypothetical protein
VVGDIGLEPVTSCIKLIGLSAVLGALGAERKWVSHTVTFDGPRLPSLRRGITDAVGLAFRLGAVLAPPESTPRSLGTPARRRRPCIECGV